MKDFVDLKNKIDLVMNEKYSEINDIRNILSEISEYEENYLKNIYEEKIRIEEKLKKDLQLKVITDEQFNLEIEKNAEVHSSKQVKSEIKNLAPKGLYEGLNKYYDDDNNVNINVGNLNLLFEINYQYLVTAYQEILSYEKKINEEDFIININTDKHEKKIVSLGIMIKEKMYPNNIFYIIVIMKDVLTVNTIYDDRNNINLDSRGFEKNNKKILELISWDSLLSLSPIELENLILLTTDNKIDFSNNTLYASAQKGLNDFIKDLEIKNKIDRKITLNKKG